MIDIDDNDNILNEDIPVEPIQTNINKINGLKLNKNKII